MLIVRLSAQSGGSPLILYRTGLRPPQSNPMTLTTLFAQSEAVVTVPTVETFQYDDFAERLVLAIATRQAWRFKGQHSVEDLAQILRVRWVELSHKYTPDDISQAHFRNIAKAALTNAWKDLLGQRHEQFQMYRVVTASVLTSSKAESFSLPTDMQEKCDPSAHVPIRDLEFWDAVAAQPASVRRFIKNFEKPDGLRLNSSNTEKLHRWIIRVSGSDTPDTATLLEAFLSNYEKEQD